MGRQCGSRKVFAVHIRKAEQARQVGEAAVLFRSDDAGTPQLKGSGCVTGCPFQASARRPRISSRAIILGAGVKNALGGYHYRQKRQHGSQPNRGPERTRHCIGQHVQRPSCIWELSNF